MRTYFSKSKEINNSKNNNSSLFNKNRSTYYQKIYDIHSDSEEEKDNENKSFTKEEKLKERNKEMRLLKRVFKGSPIIKKDAPTWPKITHPKLPFSHTNKEEPEIRKRRIELLKPSRLYHDFHTIKWLRKKYSDSVIEKSVYSILPGNGNPNIPMFETEAKKRKRKIIKYLQSFKDPLGKEKHTKINPKYFYNQTTYDRIMKLKEIFLEFDGGGTRRMKMNQLVKLFNQNNIKAEVEEIVKLFFKDKYVKKEDYLKLYLNFYQFLNFALSQEPDFRQFMRKIKGKYESNDNNKDKNAYLPMNLNLLLDYFITKGKERSSIEKIEKAIEEMDKIINENNLLHEHLSQKDLIINNFKLESNANINQDNYKKNNVKSQDNFKRNESRKPTNKAQNKTTNYNYLSVESRGASKNCSKNMLKLFKDEEIERYEKLDFKQIMKEFSNLFNYHGLDDKEIDDKRITIKNNSKKYENNFKRKFNFNIDKFRNISKEIKSLSTMNLSTLNSNLKMGSINNDDSPVLYEFSNDKDEIIGNQIKEKMNNNAIMNLNIKNFEKYRNFDLALNATKKQIRQMMKNNNNNLSKIKIENYFKKSSSQQIFPQLKIRKTLNQQDYNSSNNKFKRIDILNKKIRLSNYKNNSVKILRNYEKNQSLINKNYNSEIINNYSRGCGTNRTFLNVFCGKSQLVNLSQDQTDFASKSKFDYVPLKFLSNQDKN